MITSLKQFKLYQEALKTKCQTEDAVYNIEIKPKSLDMNITLPFELDLNEGEAELLEANLHNVIEIVLSKYFNKSIKESVINENFELKSTLIDVRKLEQYADGIAIVCGGEYGVTCFNPEKNKIWIMVGDANPFDETYLIEFLKEFVAVDFKMDIFNQIHVEVEAEAMPGTDETGWYKWTGKNWETL